MSHKQSENHHHKHSESLVEIEPTVSVIEFLLSTNSTIEAISMIELIKPIVLVNSSTFGKQTTILLKLNAARKSIKRYRLHLNR